MLDLLINFLFFHLNELSRSVLFKFWSLSCFFKLILKLCHSSLPLLSCCLMRFLLLQLFVELQVMYRGFAHFSCTTIFRCLVPKSRIDPTWIASCGKHSPALSVQLLVIAICCLVGPPACSDCDRSFHFQSITTCSQEYFLASRLFIRLAFLFDVLWFRKCLVIVLPYLRFLISPIPSHNDLWSYK